MAKTTDRYQLPYPEPSDNNATPADMLALAGRLAEVLGAPPMTTSQRDSLTSAQRRHGMLILNTDTGFIEQWWNNAWRTPVKDLDWLLPQMTVGDIITASGTPRTVTRIPAGAANTALVSNGPGAVPSFRVPTDPTKLPTAGGTMTGDLGIHSFWERETVSGSSPMSVDFAGAGLQRSTVTGNLSFSWVNVPASNSGRGRSVMLIIPATVTNLTFPSGTRFPHRLRPTVDGETWLLAVARAGVVTVGTAWTGIGT